MKCGKKGLWIGVASLALVALAAGVAFGGPFGGKQAGERLNQMITWHLDDVLDELEASPDQRAQLLALKDRAFARLQAVHESHARDKAELVAELSKDQPDPDKLHKLLDQKLDALRPELHEGLDLLLEAHAVLTPAQRAELARRIQERHEQHRGFFGHH
ncbi:MAG TPA: periplasmic heavy metal sensor [Myxococcota bacterium]|nr:periplasmic heavy metal sensor [Myxococcota bacterium]HRY93093.1 periplasmic heavy metal sensor [Myxococcota bacterium]HSA22757.1 periplasmic heavy metal sensor [Myxococcota bacterium]